MKKNAKLIIKVLVINGKEGKKIKKQQIPTFLTKDKVASERLVLIYNFQQKIAFLNI